jgi:hypothetical protein
MSEDITTYSFDFERDVSALQQYLGSTGKNILFLHLKAADKKPEVLQIIGDNYDALIEGEQTDVVSKTAAAINYFYPDYGDISMGMKWQATKQWVPDADITARTVIFYENSLVSTLMGKKDQPLMDLFTLYHETAHTLDNNKPGGDGKRPMPENVGDAYAAMLLLSRFGQQAVPFLQKVSLWRARNFGFAEEKDHFTSLTLDKIIADSAREDFSKLNADDMLERAKDYAGLWSPPIADLEKARQAYLHMERERDPAGWLMANSNPSGYAPENIALYMAAKNALPALDPDLRTEKSPAFSKFDVSQAKRLMARAATTKLSALFTAATGKAPDADTPTIADIIRPRAAKAQGVHL